MEFNSVQDNDKWSFILHKYNAGFSYEIWHERLSVDFDIIVIHFLQLAVDLIPWLH